MYKALCVVALLLAIFALTSGSKPADASATGLPSPVIVARGKVLNQTLPIPTTTIFTPEQTGLYRLSVYATLTAGAENTNSYWSYNPVWTDDSGVLSNAGGILFSNDGSKGSFDWSNVNTIGSTIVLEAMAETAITYSVSQYGPPDGSVYSLYYTLERLE